MCGTTSHINPLYELLDHLIYQCNIRYFQKILHIMVPFFFIKADIYLHHVTVRFDANEMIATLKNM